MRELAKKLIEDVKTKIKEGEKPLSEMEALSSLWNEDYNLVASVADKNYPFFDCFEEIVAEIKNDKNYKIVYELSKLDNWGI